MTIRDELQEFMDHADCNVLIGSQYRNFMRQKGPALLAALDEGERLRKEFRAVANTLGGVLFTVTNLREFALSQDPPPQETKPCQ